ncbi:MAG: thiaminase II [Streptosporangiales bacterium]|nr:thiaminase II [Streptosporangiales bacterium]
MSESFTAELWSGIGDIYDAILAHPFLRGLADGSLSEDAFAFYVIQDSLYLRRYASALAAVASRAPGPRPAAMFARHSADAVATERELHSALLPELGISPGAIDAAEPAPVNLAYTSYMLSVIHGGSYAEGVAAVLPCYWIYAEAGSELIRRGSPDPRYQRWIDTYGGEEFAAIAGEVLAETDAIGPIISVSERDAARRHFRVASRYELMFWDAGYEQESWPVPLSTDSVM